MKDLEDRVKTLTEELTCKSPGARDTKQLIKATVVEFPSRAIGSLGAVSAPSQ